MLKLFDWLYYVMIAVLLVLAALLIGTFLPIPGNYSVKSVLSGSMEPAIHTGSVVIIKPQANYMPGDVVTFGADTESNTPITHRIVEEKAVEGAVVYITKGDADDSKDIEETPKESVIGKVLFSIPYLGYVLAAARTKIGFAVIVGIPAAIIVWEEMTKIARELRRKKEDGISNDTKTS